MLSNVEEIKRDLLHTRIAIVGMQSIMNVLEKDVRETDVVIDNLSTVSSTINILLQNYENVKIRLTHELIRINGTPVEEVVNEVIEIESEIAVQALMSYAVDAEEVEGEEYN